MRRSINTQFHLLAKRLEAGVKPILFLGAGCAQSVGLPGEADLIKQVGEGLGVQLNSLNELASVLKVQVDRCLQIRQQLSTPRNIAPFEKLASLIQQDYFHTIMTTNWDSLIETGLSSFLAPDQYKVYVRGEVPDQIIANSLTQKHPLIKIVKLHGDMMSLPVIEPSFLMKFDKPLETQISNMIRAKGVVVVGYGLKEPRFNNLIRDASPLIVDPNPHENLDQLGEGAVQVDGPDGEFENFVDSLSALLLVKDYRSFFVDARDEGRDRRMTRVVVNDKKRQAVDETVDHIRNSLEASNVHEEQVRQLARRLLESIRRRFANTKGRVCLIFIRDPSAPGGEEIEKLIYYDPVLRHEVAEMDLCWVEMNNRVIEKGPRQVLGVGPGEENEFYEKLREYGPIVLIDSVAFTGHTLEVARDELSKKTERPKSDFTAAVLLLPPETRDKLVAGREWWEVMSEGRDYTSFEVTFPWGWTTATQYLPQRTNEDPFIPHEGFSYTPKPWGDQLGLSIDQRCSVNLLLLERGQRTSTHYHLHRNETFVVLDNRLRVCLWDRYLELKKHQAIRIPRGVPHALIALDQACRVLEISTGHYDVSDDIVRLADIYARSPREDGTDDGLL
jgi:mannose-6-phosphate isomerase-like protein (cupin superfamily)